MERGPYSGDQIKKEQFINNFGHKNFKNPGSQRTRILNGMEMVIEYRAREKTLKMNKIE